MRRDRKQISCCQGLGLRVGNWEGLLTSTRFLFGVRRTAWKEIVGIERLNATELNGLTWFICAK